MAPSLVKQTALRPLLRYASTRASTSTPKASKKGAAAGALPLPQPHLTPAKLRALISIYHSSANFITPQNLSAAIDTAFAGDPDIVETREREGQYRQLHETVRRRESQTEMSRWGSQGWGGGSSSPIWNDRTGTREKQVREALYGSAAEGKPDLDILMEERQRITRQIEEDNE